MSKILSTICLSMVFAVFLSEVTANPQHPSLRIVNGTTADDGEFPYMVQIFNEYGSYFCGGSIIGDKWILTAGHCIGYSIKGGKIVYGTNVLAVGVWVKTTIRIKKSYLHPLYNLTEDLGAPYYDIGIYELEQAIPFDAKAQPLKLADAGAKVPFHKIGTLSGWGVNDTNGDVTENLQKLNLQLLNDSECEQELDAYSQKVFGVDIFNSTHNICSDDHKNGACSGDSGSPFVIDGLQYGVVSWCFKPCGSAPSAYSRLTSPGYREFIKDVTGI